MPPRTPPPTASPPATPLAGRSKKSKPAPARTPRSNPGQALFDAAALPAAIVTSTGYLHETSASLRELLGLGNAALRKVRWADLTHPSVVAERE